MNTEKTTTRRPIQCAHCKNKTHMTIIGESQYREYYPDSEYTDYHYKILLCPTCEKHSVVQQYAHSIEQDYGYDYEEGQPVIEWPGHEQFLYPSVSSAPLPVDGMPQDVKETYMEAMSIFDVSPRGSAALLRLALQQLMPHLGEKGEDLNKDIKELVKKGISGTVQQALDAVRLIGNDAVHPGQIDWKDNRETANELFNLLNFITESMITHKQRIGAIYNSLPVSKRDAINKRDKKQP